MSHFVGVAFIPRGDYTVNENYSKEGQTLENMFSMGSALDSHTLDELLAPYNEQDDTYCEINPEINELATELLQAYMNKDKEVVDRICNELIDRERGWAERTSKWNDETKSSEKLSLAEIDTKLEPIMMLSRLFNLEMTAEQFDLENDDHRQLFENLLINASTYEINEQYQVFDNYLYNEEGYYDWYEVGGRWDNFFAQDNAKNVLEDISLLKGTRMVSRINTLNWYETVTLKQEEIDNRENLENRFVKSYKEDEFGKYLEETFTDDEGIEKTKYVVDEYWTVDELFEKVEIKKYGFMNIITEQYGWEQESRMGWFGISEKDNMQQSDKEFTENTWETLVESRIDELLQDVDDNGVCKWVAVAVDFHI